MRTSTPHDMDSSVYFQYTSIRLLTCYGHVQNIIFPLHYFPIGLLTHSGAHMRSNVSLHFLTKFPLSCKLILEIYKYTSIQHDLPYIGI